MLYSPAVPFSSVYPLGVLPCAGLRLWALRQFQAFFASTASPPWRTAFSRFALVVNLGLPVLASGSNCAVKPTRLRRAAYFRSLVPSYSRFMQAAINPSASHVSKAFQAFLASSACAASATSYPSCSAAPLSWPSAFSWAAPFFKAGRSLLAFGSNFALKRTRILRAAYLGR